MATEMILFLYNVFHTIKYNCIYKIIQCYKNCIYKMIKCCKKVTLSLSLFPHYQIAAVYLGRRGGGD